MKIKLFVYIFFCTLPAVVYAAPGSLRDFDLDSNPSAGIMHEHDNSKFGIDVGYIPTLYL